MAMEANEVRVAGYGHVFVADEGTTMPTDLDTPMASADWTDLGYVTTDGVAFTFSRETEDLDAWQGDKIRVLTMKEPKTAAFTLMQTDQSTIETAFGGGVWDDTAGVGKYTPPAKGENKIRALVVEYDDGADIKYRYCFPRTQVEGDVEFTLNREGAVEYPITMGVLENVPVYNILTNDPAIVTTSAASVSAQRASAPKSE